MRAPRAGCSARMCVVSLHFGHLLSCVCRARSFYEPEVGEPRACIVVECMPGGDLAQFIEKMKKQPKGMQPEMRQLIVRSLLEALQHIHGCFDDDKFPKGVAHMDLKPSNILFDQYMTGCFLADFDTARAIGKPVGIPRAPGVTKQYTSPEMYAAYPWDRPDAPPQALDVSAAHDIFCAALVIWEVLDERHLPAFSSPEAARDAFTRGGECVLDVSNLTVDGSTVRDSLRTMLMRDPEKRPSAARVLKSDFFNNRTDRTLIREAAAAAKEARDATVAEAHAVRCVRVPH